MNFEKPRNKNKSFYLHFLKVQQVGTFRRTLQNYTRFYVPK